MKHYDTDVKKFIKNVVCLVVSGILLIAATVAWFVKASNASITMGSTSVMIPMDFSYAHIDLSASEDFLDYASSAHTVDANHADGNYDLVVRNRSVPSSPTSTAIYTYLTTTTETWTPDEYNGAWDLSALYPGEFGVYRIRYVADGAAKTLKLTFASNVSSASFNSNALSAIRVYAVAVGTHVEMQGQQQVTTTSVLGSVNTNLASVITATAADEFPVLSISGASPTDSVSIYYVIGIPATGDDTVHEALRQVGATISIQSVSVS